MLLSQPLKWVPTSQSPPGIALTRRGRGADQVTETHIQPGAGLQGVPTPRCARHPPALTVDDGDGEGAGGRPLPRLGRPAHRHHARYLGESGSLVLVQLVGLDEGAGQLQGCSWAGQLAVRVGIGEGGRDESSLVHTLTADCS